MSKRTYRSKDVKKIKWEQLKEMFSGEEIVLAIDVAKHKQFALLCNKKGSMNELFHWEHPRDTWFVMEAVYELDCSVTVVMESTSTYGDALRYQCRAKGFDIHQASAKRVHDAKEVYDGVPSLHDAKAATIIARHYWEGLTQPWRELNKEERRLNALTREYKMHQSQYQRNLNRLEACLSRHWPEVSAFVNLDSVGLEALLVTYGSPDQIAKHDKEARQLLKKSSRSMLKECKIEAIIESAKDTVGVPCIDSERDYLQALAREMRHSRTQCARAKNELEEKVDQDEQLTEMGKLIGRVTTAVLLGQHLDPRAFRCARSYQKALGLNLKEKSSGTYKSQLKLTKRGNSEARRYLYFATLRLIQKDPIVKQWYLNKVNLKAKNKTVIAVMRKLSKALWHVVQGKAFDAGMLFNMSTNKFA